MRFRDRRHAGQELADQLSRMGLREPVVLALPRGGVPVGDEIAGALNGPLDVLVVRKIGAPAQPELGVGAVAGEDPPYYNKTTLDILGLDYEADLQTEAEQERQEAHRRASRYRQGQAEPDVAGRSVVAVDDGVATGSTARVGLRSARRRQPSRLIFAAPVCAADAADALNEDADEVVCLHVPEHFVAVGQWYDEFAQLSDGDITELLRMPPT